ncbi:MAG TPA: hypothetical protein VMW27_20330 [Thermoanaerobaculia bacterium]|nr:hypothetical protein [Thermoanaerobaculia bacterium]
MPTPPTDREALIAALAEQARSDAPGPEPELEELLDYLAGRLSPDEAQRIERQIAASPETSRALLDLADLEAATATAGEQRPAELPVMAGWRDLKNQLPDAKAGPRRLPALLPAIAAALLLTTLGLGWWVWQLERELRRPVANVVSLELPFDSRAGGEKTAEVPPDTPLRLVIKPPERCSGYTAEVEGPGRGDRQTIEDLEPNESGLLTPQLSYPEPGLYTLRLWGCEPRRELGERRFRIVRG